ncbi:uncharacterized mitochondrial protein AtMg00810-like [Lathyrus oleraceus]|uniref:uncharacterized mitochondrial protein AtMg00810-like n=1 Tax=Pisum sativum TaxID=3888 RepID=UPI0021D3C4F4|nr:uncharacterized mitochondrial protein AtMg00810-like [Pisum sativum]
MSMMGKMIYFLGLQIKQLKDGIFINPSKYCKELLKRFDMDSCKAMSTPMGFESYVDQDESANPKESHLTTIKVIMKYLKGKTNVGISYPKGSICNLVGYSDVDYGGSKTNRKRTSGICHILGSALVSWACKKQACVALSTAEAE